MKKIVIILILVLVPIVAYYLYQIYQFITSGTWQGVLAGIAAVAAIILILFLWVKGVQLKNRIEVEKHRLHNAKMKKEYEETLKEDKRLRDEWYRSQGLPTPDEQEAERKRIKKAKSARPQVPSLPLCGDPDCNGWCYICDDDDYDSQDPWEI